MRTSGHHAVLPTPAMESSQVKPFLLGDEMNAKVIDMTGRRYASLVAIRQTGRSTSRDLNWLFVCDCGNHFEANGYSVRCGKIITCPTCSKERVRMASVKHGLSETVEFGIWTGIQTRCYNRRTKAFKDYGGRGIVVCDRWLESFDNFLADMGKRPSKHHSIDRKDNNGNYEPSNCWWATSKEQNGNKRNNVMVTINGITKHMTDWIRDLGLNKNTVYSRIYFNKWPIEKALTKEVRSCK